MASAPDTWNSADGATTQPAQRMNRSLVSNNVQLIDRDARLRMGSINKACSSLNWVFHCLSKKNGEDQK